MDIKCKYIVDLEKKLNERNILLKILIGIFIIMFLCLIHSDKIKGLFLDSNGKFSNELFWNAIGAIGSMIAFAGVIYTIWYTEMTRKKQNEYEYKKQQLVEEQLKFKEQVMEILNEVNLACIIEIITRVNEDNFFQISQELNKYRLIVKNLNYKLYWYYNQNIQVRGDKSQTKLQLFVNKLNDIINIIDVCINEYSSKIIPLYCDLKMKKSFDEIIRLGGTINENNINDYTRISTQYINVSITDVLLHTINEVSSKVIEYSNKNWNDFVNLAKDVVSEREKIIEDILKGL